MKRLSKLVFILGTFLLLTLSADAQTQQGKIKAFLVRGQVSLINNATGNTVPLRRGMEFTEGFSIRVAESASCLLLLSNGSSLNLTPGTSVDFETFRQEPFDMRKGSYASLTADPSQSTTVTNMSFGRMVFDVKKLSPNSSFNMKTPAGAAGIRGTNGDQSTDGDTMTVRVTEGEVEVTGNDGTNTTVNSGEKVTTSNLTGTGETEEMTESEEELLEEEVDETQDSGGQEDDDFGGDDFGGDEFEGEVEEFDPDINVSISDNESSSSSEEEFDEEDFDDFEEK